MHSEDMWCALAFEPVAFEAGKPLEDHIADEVAVTGDADRLRRLVNINPTASQLQSARPNAPPPF